MSERVGQPGWYERPDMPGREYYFDGYQWTGSSRPLPAGNGIVAATYVTSVVMPLLAVVLGIFIIVRRRVGHGVIAVNIAIVMAVVWLYVLFPTD